MYHLTNEITALKNRVNQSDQYLRNYSLLLHRLKNIPPESGENKVSRKEFNEFIASELNKFFPELDTIHHSDIDIAHRLRKRNGDNEKNPVVIVRFFKCSLRHDIWDAKSSLKNKSLVITEHLTATNLTLLKKAKSVYGLKNAWSNAGIIYANVSGVKRRIWSLDDLSQTELAGTEHPPQPPDNTAFVRADFPLVNQSVAGSVMSHHPPFLPGPYLHFQNNGHNYNNGPGYQVPQYNQVLAWHPPQGNVSDRNANYKKYPKRGGKSNRY